MQLDLVAVGGGLAGLAAGLRTVELGGRALVLERSDDPDHLCASRVNGGIFHLAFRSVAHDPADLARALIAATDGFIAPALAGALGDNAARTVAWLEAMGVAFTRIEPDEGWKDRVLAPLGFYDPSGVTWRDRGGDHMVHRLERAFVERGGVLRRGLRATGLQMHDGACTGVVAQGASGEAAFTARGVVLADGGFHADPELLRRFVTPHPERLGSRAPPSGGGDGIRFAEAAGARLVGMEAFYGHLLSADSLHDARLTPFPFLDFLATAGVIVDANGTRFVDEGRGAHAIANVLARHRNGLATVVFDDAMWNVAGREFICPPNPRLVESGGTLHVADDIAALARKAGLPEDALQRTIAAHNDAIANDRAAALAPPRTTAKKKPQAFAVPPYYAAPACAAITHTMGGVAVDERARVLHRDGHAIVGLFAAGATCGGLEGGPNASYVGGLVPAAVFGLLAAETIMSSPTLIPASPGP